MLCCFGCSNRWNRKRGRGFCDANGVCFWPQYVPVARIGTCGPHSANTLHKCVPGASAGAGRYVKFYYKISSILIFGLFALVVGAQLVRLLPLQTMLLVIGLPIVLFALLQLAGVEVKLSGQSFRVAAGIGTFAGFIGGLSGIWGPPTVAYLAALGTNKNDHM